ncbi:phage terminase large subunit family protein [Brevundimonas sp. VNH65]|uniref:phage terminase large subunit family protein n=1 Tax=Brevundimonas sp. VNH65 TaxID=3400917 RepID=UPI003C084D66
MIADYADTLAQIRRDALAMLRPPPKIATADWIEENFYLPMGASALPGRMRLWAYQRGICDALDDPSIRRITLFKSARIGYSALMQGVLASWVWNTPVPIMVVLPTSADARTYAVSLEETVKASPSLRGSFFDDASDDRSTMYDRRFPGGFLKFVGAASPRNLRSHTVQNLILDEVDGYEATAEGDPVALAIERTRTFPTRKILMGSTPIFDTGPISRTFEQSDKRIWEVPCPSCGEFSEIRWGDIRWENRDPATTYWRCPNNGCVVTEEAQPGMVARGRWRATAPEVKGHAGFRINALASPHEAHRWSVLVAEFLEAKKTPETLQVFTNTTLGEVWRTNGEEVDEDALAARREPFSLTTLPPDVLFLTAGVDVQNDRLEVVILGHGRTALYALDHRVFHGPFDGDVVWQDLDSLLRMTWSHPLGGSIRIDAAAVDSGSGLHSAAVHAFTGPRFGRRIVAIKGEDGFKRPPIVRSKGSGPPLWLVGVDTVKSRLFDRLVEPESLRFSESLEPVFFEQLVSERRTLRYPRGQPVVGFERIKGKRAETLDCMTYALAVRDLIGEDLEARAEALAQVVTPPPKPDAAMLQTVGRSSWLTSSRERSRRW